MSSVTVSIPENIVSKIDISEIYTNYTKSGNPSSYGVDLDFQEMNLFKSLKSTDLRILQCKVESALTTWSKAFRRELNQRHQENQTQNVGQLNLEAQEQLTLLEGILKHTISVDDAVDWNMIKRKEKFRIVPSDLFGGDSHQLKNFEFSKSGEPTKFVVEDPGEAPNPEVIARGFGFLTRFLRKKFVESEIRSHAESWEQRSRECKAANEKRQLILQKLTNLFNAKQQEFVIEMANDNAAVDDLRKRYEDGDPGATEEYCDIVLTNSSYPELIPRNWEVEYRSTNKMLLVQMDLPSPDDLPRIQSYRYVKSRDEVVEKFFSESARKKLYDSVVYQICLRTLHELFEADAIDAIAIAAFNGVVTARNPATGKSESKIIVSVSADKEAFEEIDLANVDPKSSFRHLKGVSAAALHGLTPIPPVIQLDKSDVRIIEGRSVDVDESINLAAMHWDDFEHLIRELFEKEFAVSGAEVKVTQASSDGGVDAIVFDPDPIRGGKIVIQAKRYTNVVGVAAVRDLYGTVMNEGANKGILVTTSDYGKDSYTFASGKPITLFNGSNLLSMLEKHGQKARINIAEAKRVLQTDN